MFEGLVMIHQDLLQAIENLRVFVDHNSESPIPSIYQLDIQDGRLIAEKTLTSFEKIVALFKLTFCSVPQETVQKRDHIQQALLEAVATVASHSPLIVKMKLGSAEEKEFAESALDVINRFNAVVAKDDPNVNSWIRYIYEHNQLTLNDELKKSAIRLPHAVSFDSDSSLSTKKISRCSNTLSKKFSTLITPSQPELDLFLMKTITLLHKEQIPKTSIQEALSFLKAEPPHVIEHERKEQSHPAIVSLQKIFRPFPGETIELTGSFKRISQSLLSIPIPESFRISSQSTQTGYPDPLQHTGNALSDALFPHPLRLDQLPLFHDLAEKKRQIATALLPKGHLREKAKLLIEAKRGAFEKERSEFIELHKRLGKAIIAAAGVDTSNNCEIVNRFYAYVEKQERPYDYMADINRILEEKCLSRPYHRLYEEWLEIGNPDLRGNDMEKKFQCASKLLKEALALGLDEIKQEQLAPEAVSYLKLMGVLLGEAAQQIIMESMTEKIVGLKTSMLNDFQRKVLACAIGQVRDFVNGILEVSQDDVGSLMKRSIEEEIALFETRDFDELTTVPAEIVAELEAYYFLISQKKYNNVEVKNS